MDDAKKRGRPTTKAPEDSGDSGAGGGSSTIPKKRGRPANPHKTKKLPSGRGRGRPAKNAPAANVTPKRVAAVDEDGGNGVSNGDTSPSAPAGRGRPPKQGKLKLSHSIEPTGKGRGRPKVVPKSDDDDGDDDDEEDGDDDDEDAQSAGYKPNLGSKKPIKPKTQKSQKKAGRPKKIASSSEDNNESDDDDDLQEAPGRPSTGAVNLNIARTGRGQGRPPKIKRAAIDTSPVVANGIPKKRGRPTTSKATPYVATGKPRGRPKVNDQPLNSTSPTSNKEESDDDEDDDVASVSDDDENESFKKVLKKSENAAEEGDSEPYTSKEPTTA